MGNKKIFSSASRMTEESYIEALEMLDVKGIKKGIETLGINAKLSVENTVSVDNGMDYVHYRETVRPLDLVKGRSGAVEKWLRSLGQKIRPNLRLKNGRLNELLRKLRWLPVRPSCRQK